MRVCVRARGRGGQAILSNRHLEINGRREHSSLPPFLPETESRIFFPALIAPSLSSPRGFHHRSTENTGACWRCDHMVCAKAQAKQQIFSVTTQRGDRGGGWTAPRDDVIYFIVTTFLHTPPFHLKAFLSFFLFLFFCFVFFLPKTHRFESKPPSGRGRTVAKSCCHM